MEWLQRIYMAILNPIYGITGRVSEKNRNIISFVAMFLIYGALLVWYSINMFDIYISLTSRMLLAALLMAIFIIFINNGRCQIIRWNKLVSISWCVCGILILLMGFVARQNLGYWLIGPAMAFGFPCLYFVLGNVKDINKYFCLIGKAIVVASMIYFLLAIFAEFISDNVWDATGRYNGTTSDANRIGEICVASFLSGIYIYISIYSSIFWKIASMIVMAFCVCDAILSISRSTMMAVGCIIIYYIFLEIKTSIRNKNSKRMIANLICIALCVVIGFAFAEGMRSLHKYVEVEKAIQNTVEQSQMELEEKVIKENVNKEIQEAKDSKRMSANGKDLNTFSSGRINIWKEYISKIRILGNSADGKTPITENLTNVAAHNSVIEISYRSGAITGVMFLLVEIISGIYVLIVLFRKENEEHEYMAAFSFIGYVIVSNLQVAYNPLTSIIFFVYAISISVLFLSNTCIERKGLSRKK